MNTYIFAIGGTGARVLRSLTMLLAAGCKGTSAKDTIIPVIIDYDTENGSTLQAQNILECYQRIHDAAYRSDDVDNENFFCTPVRKLKEISKAPDMFNQSSKFDVFLGDDEVKSTFGDHIGFSTINDANGTQSSCYLLEALYDKSEGVNAELQLSLDKGFKGCPNIGCVVTKRLTNTEELQQFMIMIGQQDNVLIVGSIFGGTGASGIPMLLDLFTANNGIPVNKIGVIAVEPYFKVASSDDSVINTATFEAKTKAALEAYDLGTSVNKQADAIYYVGDDDASEALKNEEGGALQKNPAHFAELIAGICAIDFITRNIPHTNVNQDALFYETWLNLPGKNQGNNNNVEENKEAPTIRVSAFFDKELEEPYISALSRLALFNEFCKNYYLECGQGEGNDVWLRNTNPPLHSKSDFRTDLKTFINAFEKWVTEMETSKRSLKLFDISDKEYSKLLADKVMTKSRLRFGTAYAVSDGGKVKPITKDEYVREVLGEKFNNQDLKPEERTRLLSRPCYFFLKSMTEATEGFYEIIQKWTKEKAAGK